MEKETKEIKKPDDGVGLVIQDHIIIRDKNKDKILVNKRA